MVRSLPLFFIPHLFLILSMSASDSEDAMQRFLRSLEIPATGEPAPGGTQFSVTASAVSESMSLPDDAPLPDFSFTSGLPLVPGTVTVAPLIVMDPQALQALGNFVRSLRKDTWLPEQMKEWDGFIAVSASWYINSLEFHGIVYIGRKLRRTYRHSHSQHP